MYAIYVLFLFKTLILLYISKCYLDRVPASSGWPPRSGMRTTVWETTNETILLLKTDYRLDSYDVHISNHVASKSLNFGWHLLLPNVYVLHVTKYVEGSWLLSYNAILTLHAGLIDVMLQIRWICYVIWLVYELI